MKIRSKIAIDFLLLIWGAAFILLFVLPFESRFGNEFLCFLLSGIFVITIITSAIIFLDFFQRHKYRFGRVGRPISLKLLKRLIVLFSVLSLIGIFFILYDRIVIRGIDYSLGLRNARYQWLNSQGGSLISVTGNLLVPFSYCVLFWVIFHWEKLGKGERLIGVMSGVGVPMCHALINGGRSNILLAVLFTVSVFVCRYASGLTFIPKMKHAGLTVLLIGAILFVAVFSVFLSSASGVSMKDYTIKLVELNGGKVTEFYLNRKDNLLVDVVMLFTSYLFHGQWRFGQIIDLDIVERVGDDLIYPMLLWLQKFHLYSGEVMNPPMLSGNFLNLPASFYYSLGYAGIFVGAVFIGAFFGRALYHLNHFEKSDGFTVIFVIAVLMFLYSSCICIIFGFAYFIFVIYAFVAADIFIRLFWGKRSWTTVQN